MATTTLYPPVVDTYMPAFTVTEEGKNISPCRVYFAISNYNVLGQDKEKDAKDGRIRSVWVSITNQYTNASVVKTDPWKSGLISFDSIGIDNTREGDDKYYIDITDTMLEKGWERGQVYKIQLRFCSAKNYENDMTWPVNHSDWFSEWSTVCLVQGILTPTIDINGFNSEVETILRASDNAISGTVKFNKDDNDFLNSYQIQVLKQDNLGVIEYDTGILYPALSAPNEINCNLEYAFQDGVRYQLKVFINSDKLYSTFIPYDFYILDTIGGKIDATISATAENEMGRIKISVASTTELAHGNFTIRRASIKTNFMVWEDVTTLSLSGNDFLNFNWYDYGIETGVWYKYCIQKRNYYGNRGIAVLTQEPVMAFFDDMFLVGQNGQQLKIKFNPQINSYSRTILESSTQTIGSQYPFIKRNGHVNYRQFSISGLISHFMDDYELFVDKEELYFNSQKLYEKYNETHRITPYNDFNLERHFREKVEAFLTNSEVKLFKSTTEGTLLVKLMNVSFNPEPTLGRMLYSFSANVVEIDDYSIKNLDKYNIQSLGQYKILYKDTITKHLNKAISINEFSANKTLTPDYKYFDLYNYLVEQENLIAENNVSRIIQKINSLKIDFQIDPYLIEIKSNDINIAKQDNIKNANNLALGYLLSITSGKANEKNIFINQQGYYELKDTDISSVKIIIPVLAESDNIVCSIECNYDILEQEDLNQLPSLLNYYNFLGYEEGVFIPTDNIIRDFIYEKYKAEYTDSYWQLYALHDLIIEAEPNSIWYLQNSADNKYERFIINDTGELHLSGSDYLLTGLYGVGLHFKEKEKVDNNANAIYKYAEPNPYEYADCRTVSNKEGAYFTNIAQIEEELIDPENTLVSSLTEEVLKKLNLTLEQDEMFLKLTNEERLNKQFFIQKNGVYKVKSLEGIILSELKNTQGQLGNNYMDLLAEWVQPYNINGEYYNVMYYNNNWYLFTKNNDILYSVPVALYYYGEKEKGVYALNAN